MEDLIMQTTVPFPRAGGQAGARRPRRRWLRWLSIPLILAVLGGGLLWWRSSQQATTPTATTATVSQGDLTVAVSGSGAVAAARTVDLPLQQAGTVTSVDVTVGDTVAAGQAIAQIDSSALQRALAQAQANLTAAQAQLAQVQNGAATAQELTSAQVQLDSAQAQLAQTVNGTATAADIASAKAQLASAQANLTNLKQGGSAAEVAQAQASVTQAQANLDSLTAPATGSDLASAQATVTQAEVAVATAQANLDAATLKAPFDGVVSVVNIVEGSTISAGTSAVTLVDASALHIDVSLSETDAANVQVGQPVTLTFDALPDLKLSGQVMSVAPVATEEQNVVTYTVQVAFDPGETAVKVGMSATADITVYQASGVLLVPSRAIQTSGNTKTLTVRQGEALVVVPLETGLVSDGQTAIVSSGGDGIAAIKASDVVEIPSATNSTSTANAANTSTSTGLSSLTGAGGPPSGAPPGP
jgi:HlyD family secretion protein